MFDWIVGVIASSGYVGIFFLLVLENIFPPIPSELIIPLAGYSAAQGELNVFLVIAVATLGAVTGALPWYYLGKIFGLERLKKMSLSYGRILTLSPDDIDSAEGWFLKHGRVAVLFGRLIPGVRTLISVPAGIARMPMPTFLLYTTIGSAIWNTALVSLGYFLGNQHEQISGYLGPVSDAVILLIVAIYVYRFMTFGKKQKEV
ncbi:MAG: DedA family protein [Candidatus Paceibacterota bacterium]